LRVNEKKEITAEIKQVTQVLIDPGVARALLTRGNIQQGAS